MADDRVASIADSSKPNPGRIYDYMLGGNHNFEVDRLAAQELLKTEPNFPKALKTIRWFLGEAIRRLLAEGYTQFIDFASGLPTVDHIHQIAPKGTKVVYSDIDPVTVAYGQEILKDNPDARYIQCNIGTPEKLLDDPEMKKFIDKGRKTAIGMNGIAWFISDENLSHALKVLYDWTGADSSLYISDYDLDFSKMTERLRQVDDKYKKMEQPFFLRTRDTFAKLCAPWKVREPGFKPLEEWIGVNAGVAAQTLKDQGGQLIGGFLQK